MEEWESECMLGKGGVVERSAMGSSDSLKTNKRQSHVKGSRRNY